MQSFAERLKTIPVLGAMVKFADQRPRLAAWIVLSLGIVILLLIEARDVGLLLGQWIALIVASVLVAGLCIWIVTWEDGVEEPVEAAKKTESPAAPATPIESAPTSSITSETPDNSNA